MGQKVFLIYREDYSLTQTPVKQSIVTTSDTKEEVELFVKYLEEGNVDRDCSYNYEEVKFVKKLKQD